MKNRVKYTKRGFTLIELLTVIAIIGILAGILIPTVGAVRKQANIAASKSQFNGYVNAMLQFRSEYGFFPTFGASGGGDTVTVPLGSRMNNTNSPGIAPASERFVETLSARDSSGNPSSGDGNRRQISFISFSDNDFFILPSGDPHPTQLADRFNNTHIVMYVDGNGNGRVQVPSRASDGGGLAEEVRSPVVILSWPNDDSMFKFPEILSWK